LGGPYWNNVIPQTTTASRVPISRVLFRGDYIQRLWWTSR